jgi:peptidoglycan/LPS O-acetylase OafA/YrhL
LDADSARAVGLSYGAIHGEAQSSELGAGSNYEMFFYFCFFLILMLPRKIGLWVLIAGFGFAVVSHVVLLPQVYIRFLSVWTNSLILEFLFGIGLAYVFVCGIRWPKLVGWLIAVLGLGLMIAADRVTSAEGLNPGGHNEFYRPVILGIPSLIVCAGLALSDNRQRSPKWQNIVLFGGNISYSLYLSHEFTFNMISPGWRALGLSSPWFLIALLCIASIVISAVIYQFFERPVTKGLNRLFGAPPHRAIQLPEVSHQASSTS